MRGAHARARPRCLDPLRAEPIASLATTAEPVIYLCGECADRLEDEDEEVTVPGEPGDEEESESESSQSDDDADLEDFIVNDEEETKDSVEKLRNGERVWQRSECECALCTDMNKAAEEREWRRLAAR